MVAGVTRIPELGFYVELRGGGGGAHWQLQKAEEQTKSARWEKKMMRRTMGWGTE